MRKIILFVIIIVLFCIVFAESNPYFRDKILIPQDTTGNAYSKFMSFAPPQMQSFAEVEGISYLAVSHYNPDSSAYDGLTLYGGSSTAFVDAPLSSSMYNSFTMDNNYCWYALMNANNGSSSDIWYTYGDYNFWYPSRAILDSISQPQLFNASITGNFSGSNLAIVGLDSNGYIGTCTSSDYGITWDSVTVDSSISELMSDIQVIKPIFYTQGQSGIEKGIGDVIAFFGGTFYEDSTKMGISCTAKGLVTSVGYAFSSDGGSTYSDIKPLFDGHSLPDIPEINGDTFIFYIDTVDNNLPNYDAFHAYIDPVTGEWTDDFDGTVFDDCGFGSWWYWWNAEVSKGVVYIAIPYAECFVDYYDNGGDVYTFPWQGQSIMFGAMNWAAGDTVFNWHHIDVHDPLIQDTTGRTYTHEGYPFNANIVTFDDNDAFIVFGDNMDTSGLACINWVEYDFQTDSIYNDPGNILYPEYQVNGGLMLMECNKNGWAGPYSHSDPDTVHIFDIAYVTNNQDSVYTETVWEFILGKNPSGNTIPSLIISLQREPLITFEKTIMNLVIEKDAKLEISMFDISGRFEDNIFTGILDKGEHTFALNKSLPSGVHFVKVNMNGQDYYNKICIIR